MKKRLIINRKRIVKNSLSIILGFLSIVGTFFTLFPIEYDTLGLVNRIAIIIVGVVFCVFFTTWECLKRETFTIKNHDNKKINVCYGDLMDIAFSEDNQRKIVVVPVNRCFDTIVDDKLVESGSVHGQWIKKFVASGITLEELDARIENGLKNVKYEQLTVDEKPKGKKHRYPIGTVVEITGKDGVLYYLIALTTFNETLTAHCDREEYMICLQHLIEHYDTHGHIASLYMPVMGSEFARLNLSIKDAADIILAVWKMNYDKIHGDINIVIYKKHRDIIAITDFG